MNNIVIGVRRMLPRDLPYVASTWRNSYWSEGPHKKHVLQKPVYKNYQSDIQERLLTDFTCFVVYDPETPENLLGWICGDRIQNGVLVHYVYVTKKFRLLGIGAQMLKLFHYDPARESIVATHWTNVLYQVRDRYPVLYNPYLVQPEFYKEEPRVETNLASAQVLRYRAPERRPEGGAEGQEGGERG